MNNLLNTQRIGLVLACSLLLLQACSSDDDNPVTTPPPNEENPATVDDPATNEDENVSFSITAVNLTAGQPMSPPIVVLHSGDYRFFTVGAPASTSLELLAEGGDSSALVDELANNDAILSSAAASNPIAPGGRDTWTLNTEKGKPTRYISMATMLVNTNDGISGVNRLDVSGMGIGDSMQIDAIAYDSGTEANSEAQGTIPGPADGGEGFNTERDDIADRVAMHSGVVTSDDGLSSSILTNDHRFLNPVLRITVTRSQ